MIATMQTYRLPKPQPPTQGMIEALARSSYRTAAPSRDRHVPPLANPNAPLFEFNFKQPWLGVFTMPKQKFVLRSEHVPELTRLTREFNKYRPSGEDAIGLSDIVNAALDLVLAHHLSFTDLEKQEQIRERMAEVVYRRAFLRFLSHDGR